MGYADAGPGKYDAFATHCRLAAEGVVVIVVGGNLGHGFAVQGPERFVKGLPEMLERMAADLRILRDSEQTNG